MTKPEILSFLQTYPKFFQTLRLISTLIKESIERDPKCDWTMDELTVETDFGRLGEYLTDENFSEKHITISDGCIKVQIGFDALINLGNRKELCEEVAAKFIAEIQNHTKEARERREQEERRQLAELKKKYEHSTDVWHIDFKDDKFILWGHVADGKHIFGSDNNISNIVHQIWDSQVRQVIVSDKAAEVVVSSSGEYPGSYDKALTQVMLGLQSSRINVSSGAVARL